jgi:hypothetical protein
MKTTYAFLTGKYKGRYLKDNTRIPAKQQQKGLTPTSPVNKPHSPKQQLDGNGT